MADAKSPTVSIRKKAAAFPKVAEGTFCNQSSFKTRKRAFLYIGPGPKGQGFKAMFKLKRSMPRARQRWIEGEGNPSAAAACPSCDSRFPRTRS